MKRKVKIIIWLSVVLFIVIAAGFMTKKWWAGADVVSNDPLKTAQTDLSQSSVVKVKIPVGVTKKDIENIAKQKNKDESKEDLLNNAVEQKFDELEPQIVQIEKVQSTMPDQNQNSFQDYIIVYTDENDNPILPDAEKDQSFISTFQDREQNELTFTWDSSWDTADPKILEDLKNGLKKIYPEIKKNYGRPAFNITINIRYDYPGSTYYNPSANEIVLSSYGMSDLTLAHETTHAFHDDYCISIESWEEGMTTLVENRVGFNLNYKSSQPVNWADYELKNRPDIDAKDSSLNYIFSGYNDGGAVWLKLLLEDPNYLINFNKKYYNYRRSSTQFLLQSQYLPVIASQAKPEVEKEPFMNWYYKQYIFHQESFGYQLGSRVNDFNSQWLELSYVKHFWNYNYLYEVVKDGIKVQIFDPNDNLIYESIHIPNVAGYYDGIWQLKNIFDKSNVDKGRFKIELSAKAESDYWKLESTNYAFYVKDIDTQMGDSIYPAIYGLVDNQNNGEVTIKSLSKPDLKPVTIPVDDGIFYTAEFAGIAGLFQLDYISPDGKTTAIRYFTKDYRSTSTADLPYYYVFVSTDKEKPALEINTKQVANTSATFQVKTNERSIAYLMINENKDNIIKENKDFFKKVVQENANQEWVETRLKKDTTYYYQFWAIDFAGNITKSEIKTLKTTNEASPVITNASPINGAKNVPVDISQISLQFDKSLDPKTVIKNNIYFQPIAGMGEGGGPNIPSVSYQVTYNETAKKIVVSPTKKLQYNVEYVLFLSEVTDTKGNLIENFDYKFTTQIVPGSTKPKVISVSPQPKSENNPLNSKIEIEFNVKIKPDDINSIFWVNARNSTEQINGTTQLINGKKLVFTPNKPLPKNRLIYVYAMFGFKDEAGNWIIPYDKFWKFRTGEN